jgi:hypothetical protein
MSDHPVKLRGGLVLDDALVEKLSAQAEAGPDFTDARRVHLRRGRPSKGEQRGESPRVSSRVSPEVYMDAKRRAQAEGITLSNVLRALLSQYAKGAPHATAPKSSGRK